MAQVNGSLEAQNTSGEDEVVGANTTDLHVASADPLVASTSLQDTGQTKRPRDARLLHIILASLGVQAYQERVPLQLMDFAYRYTSSALQDALHLTNESYGQSGPGSKNVGTNDLGSVTLQALRLAVASRQQYQFQPNLPKEHFQEIAIEKNKVALPTVGKSTQIRLPPERYCLTGVGYSLKDEWEDELNAMIEPEMRNSTSALDRLNGASGEDSQMQGVERMEKTAASDDEEMRDV